MRRVLLVSLVLATVMLAASSVRAQMMGAGNGMTGMPGFFSNGTARGASMLTAPHDMTALARSWLDALHAELGIAPAQEGAWLAFANAVVDAAEGMRAFRGQMGQLPAATAPQRAALLAQFMRERHDDAAAMAAAMTTLYDALTPAQRSLMDARFGAACAPGGLFGN